MAVNSVGDWTSSTGVQPTECMNPKLEALPILGVTCKAFHFFNPKAAT